MGFFGSRKLLEPTLTERFNIASATHAAAYAVFTEVAAQLDEAADLYNSVAAEAEEEITRLIMIRDDAIVAATNARKSTEHVLNLTRGIPV